MYSGATIRPLTGKMLGAHQKIDRLARAGLRDLIIDNDTFPTTKLILHFEGVNGPDALKRKSPAKDEPWHFYSPFDETDNRLVETIGEHYDNLVQALKSRDEVRAAFEAAWLAHAIVDGLTPAHHYPYEEKLAEIRGGENRDSRDTLKGKLIMPGDNGLEMLVNNWKMWGPRGLINAHGVFEWGVAVMMAPLYEKRVALKKEDIAELNQHGVLDLFRMRAKEIAAHGVYESYMKHGWTPSLARLVRKKVVPVIVRMVTLSWYAAAVDAGLAKKTAL
ncbi:MAG TPA: hypothetical protein VL737_00550 [Candidatus Pristimantibacillus sp.]|nr:hypothetical protein [Candidatus Pristimantibacillus sp.]